MPGMNKAEKRPAGGRAFFYFDSAILQHGREELI
jgi:hypothetical protein